MTSVSFNTYHLNQWRRRDQLISRCDPSYQARPKLSISETKAVACCSSETTWFWDFLALLSWQKIVSWRVLFVCSSRNYKLPFVIEGLVVENGCGYSGAMSRRIRIVTSDSCGHFRFQNRYESRIVYYNC